MLSSASSSLLTRTLPTTLKLGDALRRLHDQPTLLAWRNGNQPDYYLAWQVRAHPLRSAEDLQPVDGYCELPPLPGWGNHHHGAFIQCDYELPVGPWALDDGQRPVRGWQWLLDSYLHADSSGKITLYAIDADTLENCYQDICTNDSSAPSLPTLPATTLSPAWTIDQHKEHVETIRAAIAQGDCYQANLTLPFHKSWSVTPQTDLAVFSALSEQSPAGYSAFLRHNNKTIISHSPECFIRCDGTTCESYPIKGTRKRIAQSEERLRSELLLSEKDNAELAMIVDLMRNDFGRIAKIGSVSVHQEPHVIDLPYVHHLVACVRATLHSDVSVADILRAAFPAGSITGAPKLASMKLLQKLETEPRGAYCGTFGWIGSGSACDLAVAIRTLTITSQGITINAGGGIVTDSDGTAEWAEALAKASAMATAINGALPCD